MILSVPNSYHGGHFGCHFGCDMVHHLSLKLTNSTFTFVQLGVYKFTVVVYTLYACTSRTWSSCCHPMVQLSPHGFSETRLEPAEEWGLQGNATWVGHVELKNHTLSSRWLCLHNFWTDELCMGVDCREDDM